MNTYPHYKPSGIDWIGEIPEHWEVKKLKYVDLVIMGQSPDSEDYLDDEKATPFLQGNADFGQLFPIPRVYCNAVSKTSRQNDILLSVRAPIGAINISDKEYGIGRGLCAVRALTSNYKFLFYHMIIKHEELNSIGTGSTYKAVTVENVKSTNLIFPPLSEQTAIANYLDRKTAEIDQTIADKEALIGLYEEEKKGLINEAVTKGLNPNVPLKPSNIEWLGDVAEHWEVKKLKYWLNIITTKSEIQINKVGLENIESNTGNYIETDSDFEGEGISFIEDDILFGKLRPYLAKVYLSKFKGSAVGDFFVLRCKDKVLPKFAHFRLLGYSFIYVCNSSTFGAKMPRVGWDFLSNLKIAFPPIPEQAAIVDYIETETAKINEKMTLARQEIELLKEFRQALIFECVTGKVCCLEEKIDL